MNIIKRLEALEARQPRPKDEGEQILAAMTDEELDALEPIVERFEQGIEPTTEEKAFLDDLEARYATK